MCFCDFSYLYAAPAAAAFSSPDLCVLCLVKVCGALSSFWLLSIHPPANPATHSLHPYSSCYNCFSCFFLLCVFILCVLWLSGVTYHHHHLYSAMDEYELNYSYGDQRGHRGHDPIPRHSVMRSSYNSTSSSSSSPTVLAAASSRPRSIQSPKLLFTVRHQKTSHHQPNHHQPPHCVPRLVLTAAFINLVKLSSDALEES